MRLAKSLNRVKVVMTKMAFHFQVDPVFGSEVLLQQDIKVEWPCYYFVSI